jgi:glycosyltransferase involved in cell wall biosynthesis
VNKDLAFKVRANQGKYAIIPCHLDEGIFHPINKTEARNLCNLTLTKRYILFSSSFDNHIKNYSLAQKACKIFKNLELIELKGYSRKNVNLLLNACDLALITSFNEGSSQFLKEAMACNCPIVTTKVGDVELIIGETEGCYITSFDQRDCTEKIKLALEFSEKFGKTRGRDRIMELNLDPYTIAKKIIKVYQKVLST